WCIPVVLESRSRAVLAAHRALPPAERESARECGSARPSFSVGNGFPTDFSAPAHPNTTPYGHRPGGIPPEAVVDTTCATMYRCVAHYRRSTTRRWTGRSLQRRQRGCLPRRYVDMSGEHCGRGLEGVQAAFEERRRITCQWPQPPRVGIPLVRRRAGERVLDLL